MPHETAALVPPSCARARVDIDREDVLLALSETEPRRVVEAQAKAGVALHVRVAQGLAVEPRRRAMKSTLDIEPDAGALPVRGQVKVLAIPPVAARKIRLLLVGVLVVRLHDEHVVRRVDKLPLRVV